MFSNIVVQPGRPITHFANVFSSGSELKASQPIAAVRLVWGGPSAYFTPLIGCVTIQFCLQPLALKRLTNGSRLILNCELVWLIVVTLS